MLDRQKSLPLTPREHEVLKLVADGYTNKKIAAHLGIGIKTVETHRANIVCKLGAANSAEAIRKALEKGLIR